MASAVDNGLVAASLLAGATTSPLPRGSNNSYNTPGGTTANRSSRKGGYQIEHIWADRPERHEDDLGTRQISHPIVTESAGSSCCPQEKTPATATWPMSKRSSTMQSRTFLLSHCRISPMKTNRVSGDSRRSPACPLPLRRFSRGRTAMTDRHGIVKLTGFTPKSR